jgi:hypothetical protein
VETAVMISTSSIISITVTSNPSGRASASFTSIFTRSFYNSLFLDVERSIDVPEQASFTRNVPEPYHRGFDAYIRPKTPVNLTLTREIEPYFDSPFPGEVMGSATDLVEKVESSEKHDFIEATS